MARRLVAASCLVFLAGLAVSGVVFYRNRPFDVKAAVLSDLQSPDDNPHGYGAAAVGTALAALLLAPAAAMFYRRLRKGHPKLAISGAAMFALGLAAAISIGILAPFTHGYTPLHVQLAAAAFIGVFAGTWLHLLAARAAPAVISLQFLALLVLIFLCYGPIEFHNDRLFTSLAFWEWVLCTDCAAALCLLSFKLP